jgi:hypothetical protein
LQDGCRAEHRVEGAHDDHQPAARLGWGESGMSTHEPQDPFEEVTFDDAFVEGASVREQTADERVERLQRIDAEHRRIVEAARAQVRAQAETTSYPTVFPPSGPRRRRRPWALLVVAILVVTFFWIRSREGSESSTSAAPPVVEAPGHVDQQAAGSEVRLAGGQPPPGRDAQAQPLGQPPPLPRDDGPFRFVAEQRDQRGPVAYDPCRPIHLVVNDRTAPVEGDAVFREALERVSQGTGLQFIVDGPTTEAPVAERAPYQPSRYPDRWAPVLVAWSDAVESTDLQGSIAGEAGSSWFELADGSVYVSGVVVLDGPDLAEVLDSPDGRELARSIILHELGHLVGLDHVDDPSQLMYRQTNGEVTDFGAGDLRGLAQLGTGRCFPNV